MKKLILGIAMMIGFISFSSAQQVAKTKPAAKNVTTAKPTTTIVTAPQTTVKKPATATVAATPATPKAKAATPAKPTNEQGQVVKKDGTPDKRYKDAPTTAKSPVKKDGTPDKRYKENKKQ